MSASDDLADFWVHEITVVPYLGEGAYGSTYGPESTAAGFVDDSRKSVRTAGGDEVVSEATFYGPPDLADRFAPESRVTLWAGSPAERTATVITLKRLSSGSLGLPDHVEVTLT